MTGWHIKLNRPYNGAIELSCVKVTTASSISNATMTICPVGSDPRGAIGRVQDILIGLYENTTPCNKTIKVISTETCATCYENYPKQKKKKNLPTNQERRNLIQQQPRYSFKWRGVKVEGSLVKHYLTIISSAVLTWCISYLSIFFGRITWFGLLMLALQM